MKALFNLILMWLLSVSAISQSAQVVQLEHSLRWLTESNFPNFIQDPYYEKELINQIDYRLKQKFQYSTAIFPEHFTYRLISMFGKSKIKLPKSSEPDYQIAIVSAITRGTSNYKVFWNMQVEIQQNKKIIHEKEVEHELEPYSVSIRMSNQSWMDQNEFVEVFLFLLEECLGIQEYIAEPIALGSLEMVQEKVASIMPIAKEYRLAVAGAMMEESTASYKLLRDSLVLNEFSYKPTSFFEFDLSISGKQIFADLFTQITSIGTYYTLKSKEHRTGAIYTNDNMKRKVRLDWLEESTLATDEDNEDAFSRIISPITGQYFDQDSLIAQFIFYEEIKPIENLTLHEMQFQMDEDMKQSIYAIIGNFRGTKFDVVYREFDELVFIKINDRLNAVLSLININPESQSAAGYKFSKNKSMMVSTVRPIKKREVAIPTAEWYPFYTIEEVNDETAIEMGYFLLLLFFAIGYVG